MAKWQPVAIHIFFWYALVVSLLTAGLELFFARTYVERELKFSERARRRYSRLGLLLLLGTPFYFCLYFYFFRTGWMALSIAMGYPVIAEFLLRGRRTADGAGNAAGDSARWSGRRALFIQSYALGAINLVIAAWAAVLLWRS